MEKKRLILSILGALILLVTCFYAYAFISSRPIDVTNALDGYISHLMRSSYGIGQNDELHFSSVSDTRSGKKAGAMWYVSGKGGNQTMSAFLQAYGTAVNEKGILVKLYNDRMDGLDSTTAKERFEEFFKHSENLECTKVSEVLGTVMCEKVWLEGDMKNFQCAVSFPYTSLFIYSVRERNTNYPLTSCFEALKTVWEKY